MSKRNLEIVNSPESKALKRLREEADLSLRELAKKMNISYSRVHQMERGRDDPSEEYIKLFLSCLNLSFDKWNEELGSSDDDSTLRKNCLNLVSRINSEKLIAVEMFLKTLL